MTFASLLHDFSAPKVPLLPQKTLPHPLRQPFLGEKTVQKRHLDFQNGRKLLQKFPYGRTANEKARTDKKGVAKFATLETFA